MNIKKFANFALVMALSLGLTACGGNSNEAPADDNKAATEAPAEENTEESKEDSTEAEAPAEEENKEEATNGETKKIAVLLYNGSDTYIASVRQQLEKLDEADDSIEFVFQDGQKNQGTQTDQINNVVAQGVDGIMLNIVDISAASTAMETIKAAGIPTIFFNRDMTESLTEEDLDNFFFVGTNAPEAGVMQGEILTELWNAGDMDRNGNGKLDYVMLNGGLDNPEAQARTEYSVKTLEENGIEVNEVAFQDAQWNTNQAKTAMDTWLQTDKDDIDAVIANNDEMAIGAISALQAVGMNTGSADDNIVVVGVDATDPAIAEIDKGTMSGTVKQDAEGMAKALVDTIKNKLNGGNFKDTEGYDLGEDGKSFRIKYQKYTK
ncbi:galactose ABC transporter substrate-binding protein [Anaerococcus provencensis]|uniref:galactose ABC transporter substrate-binding protein n=1 Tax=Anaerococcus provencensis TaxID=938293 RepID=UPI0002D31B75|nr:galactose ABC transporter substrate-binding protein [Anaerococcus provencensis]